MRSDGRALINLTGEFMRRGNLDTQGDTGVCVQRETCEDTVRPWLLQAKDRGLKGTQPCWHLDLQLLAPRSLRKEVCVV